MLPSGMRCQGWFLDYGLSVDYSSNVNHFYNDFAPVLNIDLPVGIKQNLNRYWSIRFEIQPIKTAVNLLISSSFSGIFDDPLVDYSDVDFDVIKWMDSSSTSFMPYLPLVSFNAIYDISNKLGRGQPFFQKNTIYALAGLGFGYLPFRPVVFQNSFGVGFSHELGVKRKLFAELTYTLAYAKVFWNYFGDGPLLIGNTMFKIGIERRLSKY